MYAYVFRVSFRRGFLPLNPSYTVYHPTIDGTIYDFRSTRLYTRHISALKVRQLGYSLDGRARRKPRSERNSTGNNGNIRFRVRFDVLRTTLLWRTAVASRRRTTNEKRAFRQTIGVYVRALAAYLTPVLPPRGFLSLRKFIST